MRRLNRCEKKQYMMEKARSCLGAVSTKAYLKPKWSIGVAPAHQKSHVCRQCFCHAYGIEHTYLDKLCSDIKDGHRTIAPTLSDSTPPATVVFRKHLVELAENIGISLTPKQLSGSFVPNTTASLACFSWMESFFDAVGDKQPTGGEIHLEPTDMKEVHDEYSAILEDSLTPSLK